MSSRAPSPGWERSLHEEDKGPGWRRIRSMVRLRLDGWRSASSAAKAWWLRLAAVTILGMLGAIWQTANPDPEAGTSVVWLYGSCCVLAIHLFLVIQLLKMEPGRDWGDWAFARSRVFNWVVQVTMMAFGVLINEHIYYSHVTPYMLLGYCFYALFVAHACKFPVQFGATSALLGSTAIVAWAPWRDSHRHTDRASIITVILFLISIFRHALPADPPEPNRAA